MRLTTLLFLCSVSVATLAQEKKQIDHHAYADWKSLSEETISRKGNVVTYHIAPLKGDGVQYIEYKGKQLTFDRGSRAKISASESFVAFKISTQHDSLRKLELDKVPKKKWPKDSLAIHLLASDTTIYFHKVKSYKIGEKGGEKIAIHRTDKYELPKPAVKKKKCKFFGKKKKEEAPKEKYNGSVLTFYDASAGTTGNIEGVKEYTVNKEGNAWSWITSKTYNDSIDSCFITVNMDLENPKTIWKNAGEAINLSFDEKGNQLAFLASADTGDVKVHSLYLWKKGWEAPKMIVDSLSKEFSNYYSVSKNKQPYFSKSGGRLFFGVGKKPVKEPKDTLTKEEKYKLDLWSWTDGKLQPQQLKEVNRQKKRSDLYVYHIEDSKIVQLSDSTHQGVSIPFHNDGEYGLIMTQHPYLKEMTWDGWFYDYYRINIKTGEKEKVLEHHSWDGSLSPSGKYFTWYSREDSTWMLKNLENNTTVNLTGNSDGVFHQKYHDVPGLPGPSGGVRWLLDEQNALVQGQYDAWVCSPTGGKSYRLTKGKEKNVSYYYSKLDYEEVYIDLTKELFFRTFNEITKEEGIAKYDFNGISDVFSEPYKITLFTKAKESNKVIFRQSSLQQYPEVQLTDLTFKKRKVLSSTNPQQKDYNWASVELVSWNTYEGDSLSGLLYKPEDFDSTKKYPLMVYFYERYADNIHFHYMPKPTASIIYPTEYASNGYVIFIPDIAYKTGHPAKSAYNCIVSGTESMVKQFPFIDSTRMALQGQSWGGYQTAQLITMTNIYQCGMAGAPVSNMFSAYGGIRWGSGISRAFQYEKGQSRIGQTIWEAPELYVENSPIFHLPKVQTPLLIMHNDGDGAVPWYQGIELFAGLRRLNKPVWMLNYNGDEHNLTRTANKIDLSIRMRQFFDHYLLDKEAPQWMEQGIPAINKGKDNAY